MFATPTYTIPSLIGFETSILQLNGRCLQLCSLEIIQVKNTTVYLCVQRSVRTSDYKTRYPPRPSLWKKLREDDAHIKDLREGRRDGTSSALMIMAASKHPSVECTTTWTPAIYPSICESVQQRDYPYPLPATSSAAARRHKLLQMEGRKGRCPASDHRSYTPERASPRMGEGAIVYHLCAKTKQDIGGAATLNSQPSHHMARFIWLDRAKTLTACTGSMCAETCDRNYSEK